MNNQTHYDELKEKVLDCNWYKGEKPITNKNDLRKLLESIRRSNRRIHTEYFVPVPNKKNREVIFIIKDSGKGGYASIFVGTSLVIDVKNTNRKEIMEGVLIEKRQKKIQTEVIDDMVEHFSTNIFEEGA